jgi:hypothetical protein
VVPAQMGECPVFYFMFLKVGERFNIIAIIFNIFMAQTEVLSHKLFRMLKHIISKSPLLWIKMHGKTLI